MSNNLVNLLVKIFTWGLMGVSVIVALIFFFRISGAEPSQEANIAESFILWAVILLGIAVVISLAFPLIFFAMNPKNATKALLGLAAVGLVFIVGYFMADTTPIVTAVSDTNLDFSDPSVLRFADTGIIATYILFGVAVLALLFTGVRSLTKL
ncbi:MAG: hypothetical protein CVT98_07620 [Bacteroidetes bacterium HGW-Bacteroidetes-15]|nr:MAG: hypothetical protein CVT98_07620 [Bacteroidetes bacterium HGW-Bacteroidetes-15]